MRQELPLNPYKVSTVVWASGERMPMLLESSSIGMPLYAPTLYATMELRSRGRASATIEQALRAVMLLLLSLRRIGVDLAARVEVGQLLELVEVEELARHCRLKLDALLSIPEADPSGKVVALKKSQLKALTAQEVDPASAAIRMVYIRDYLRWYVADRQQLMTRAGASLELRARLSASLEGTLKALEARTPATNAERNTVGKRMGLDGDSKETLDDVLKGEVPTPWKNAHAKTRNTLMVRWLREVGLRRGELLGLKVSHVNFQRLTVTIPRNPDAPEDPRKRQPLTKTADRVLPISQELADLTRAYVMGPRRAIAGARRHEYLFVANGNGKPLSLSALNKTFATLREKVDGLPNDLSPHVLRHSWNDEFSEKVDEEGLPQSEEERLRNYQMGWSSTSKMGAHYSKRHTQKQARRISLKMQSKLPTPGAASNDASEGGAT
jgi:integrase